MGTPFFALAALMFAAHIVKKIDSYIHTLLSTLLKLLAELFSYFLIEQFFSDGNAAVFWIHSPIDS